MSILRPQSVEIAENCEGFVASTKRKSLYLKFFTPRALKALGVASLALIITGSVTFYFVSKSIKTRASITKLQKQEIAESTRAKQLVPTKKLAPAIQADEIWFDSLKTSDKITDEDAQALAHFVVTAIFEPQATENTTPDIINRDSSPRTVFISISNAKSTATVIRGAGNGMAEAIKKALVQVQALARTGFQPEWIKFDIVQELFSQNNVSPTKLLPPKFEHSLYGLAFDRASGLAFLPEELVARTLVDSKQKLRFKNIESYLNKSSKPTEHVQRLESERQLTTYRFSLKSFFSDGKELIPLYRGHRISRHPSKGDLLSAAVSAGQYLAQNVGSDGRFVYIYWPKTNRISDEYNILRHAGTTYSMLELYEVARDPLILKEAERALDYLVRTARPFGEGSDDILCIVEEGETKLGGNALAAIALAKYMEVTGSREHLALLIALGKWILSVQDESGRFTVHKQSYSDGRVFSFRSEYYPGEALLALNRIYTMDKKEAWLDAAERGAQYLINVRDGGLPLEQLAHDHWLLYALNELYRHRPKPLYLNHAFRIAEAIVQSQNRNPVYPDWLGSYYKPPRSTPTATRSEGLYAAYLLARDFASPERAQAILEAISLGLAFQLQTQFRSESVMYLENPQRCLGGFHRSLTNYEIRIDYVQHNISSLLGLYRLKETAKGARL